MRVCRIYFRRLRITIWILILALLGVLVYLNQVGLPGFAKEPLLDELRARGLDLQFSRLRLSWFRGLVADNARLGSSEEPLSPHLTVKEVQLGFDNHALARFHLQINAVMLRQGRLILPVAVTNEAPRELVIEQIDTYLRFLPNDQWALDQFSARFAGVKFELTGLLTNASAVPDWKVFQKREAKPGGQPRDNLRKLADALENVRFSGSPEVRINLRGDARNLTSFSARVYVNAPGAETPWGDLTGGRFIARVHPGATNGFFLADMTLDATQARTRWAETSNLQLTGHFAAYAAETNLAQGDINLCAARAEAEWGKATNLQVRIHFDSITDQTNLVNADLTARVQQIATRWASADEAQFTARWIHALTNPIPLAGVGQMQCDRVSGPWGSARQIKFDSKLATPPGDAIPAADPTWGWWAGLVPYALDWSCKMSQPQMTNAFADEIECEGRWHAPELTVSNLTVKVGSAALQVRAGLDVATRVLHLGIASGIDPHWLAPLFQPEMQTWLAKCSWEQPPAVTLDAIVTLPPWVNPATNWHEEALTSMKLAGDFNFAHGGAFEAVSFSSASSHFSCSNLYLTMPDLTVTRPEGRIKVALSAEHSSQEYFVHLQSTVDPNFLRPLFPTNKQTAFNLFAFTQPPDLDFEIHGRGQDPDRLGAKGRVALTNFTFRGETVSSVQAAVEYTNRVLLVSHPHLRRTVGELSADAVAINFAQDRIYITNGYSTTDPMVVARAIGPHIAHIVEPYQFSNPPVAHVYGVIPLHGEADADVFFDLDGGPFHWWQFNIAHVKGLLHWQGQRLDLKDMRLKFYGGDANGFARFDFHPGPDNDYQFAMNVTNVVLRSLMRDLVPQSKLDGTVNGSLVIARATTSTIRSWYGYGNVELKDGLIWDVPIFGVFSSVLNGLSPGLGSSRASAATGNFVITNAMVRTDDLEIRSTGMRLQYKGTVDFDGRVNARVEADLLRDVWLVGPVVSTVFWPMKKLFEYRVGGTLGEPKTEPVFLIPKVLLMPFQMPFHPIRTLKGLLPDDSNSGHGNAPPLNAPKSN